MSENTLIEWADHTFNPWIGCQKVGPGCDHCYAEAWDRRFAVSGQAMRWGAGVERTRTTAANWRKPVQWNARAAEFMAQHGRRQRVFCSSLADVFDKAVPSSWRVDLFRLIEDTPHLDWLLLTKRVGNVPAMMLDVARSLFWMDQLDTGEPPSNVWLGATVVNQAEADRDIPKLLDVPARVRFLSVEPMLGPIDLRLQRPVTDDDRQDMDGWCTHITTKAGAGIHWVIVGGESGPQARPMHPDWARSLRDQCRSAGVPFLFKQWGEWCPRGPESLGYPSVDGVPRMRMTDAGHNGQDLAAKGGNDVWMNRAGKKAAGRVLDGMTHDGFPAQKGGTA